MLTFLPLEQIHSLEADMQQPSYKPNTAQRLLAEQVLLFVHGKEGLSAAVTATQVRTCLPCLAELFKMATSALCGQLVD